MTKIDTRTMQGEKVFVCDICMTHVNDANSKHCGSCNRCVSKFDHHCKWLNNCIGDRNYKLFLVLITNWLVYNLHFIAAIVVFWADYKENFPTIPSFGKHIFLAFYTLGWLIFVVFALQLVIMHVYFNIWGITTYQWLVKSNLKKWWGKIVHL